MAFFSMSDEVGASTVMRRRVGGETNLSERVTRMRLKRDASSFADIERAMLVPAPPPPTTTTLALTIVADDEERWSGTVGEIGQGGELVHSRCFYRIAG